MQLATLSGYPATSVRASITAAVHRVLAKTQWNVTMIVRWVSFLSPRLLQSLSDILGDLFTWLSRSATWHWSSYASGHIPHGGARTAFCGDWSTDLVALQGLSRSMYNDARVDWGVHKGRGATAETL